MTQTLADLIKNKRIALNLSQVELSRRSLVSQGIISRIETGAYKEVPPVDVLAGLSRGLGLSQMEMLAALGYDVGSVQPPPADPVRAHVEAVLSRTRLNDDRADTICGLLERWQSFDRRTEDPINHVGAPDQQGRMGGIH